MSSHTAFIQRPHQGSDHRSRQAYIPPPSLSPRDDKSSGYHDGDSGSVSGSSSSSSGSGSGGMLSGSLSNISISPYNANATATSGIRPGQQRQRGMLSRHLPETTDTTDTTSAQNIQGKRRLSRRVSFDSLDPISPPPICPPANLRQPPPRNARRASFSGVNRPSHFPIQGTNSSSGDDIRPSRLLGEKAAISPGYMVSSTASKNLSWPPTQELSPAYPSSFNPRREKIFQEVMRLRVLDDPGNWAGWWTWPRRERLALRATVLAQADGLEAEFKLQRDQAAPSGSNSWGGATGPARGPVPLDAEAVLAAGDGHADRFESWINGYANVGGNSAMPSPAGSLPSSFHSSVPTPAGSWPGSPVFAAPAPTAPITPRAASTFSSPGGPEHVVGTGAGQKHSGHGGGRVAIWFSRFGCGKIPGAWLVLRVGRTFGLYMVWFLLIFWLCVAILPTWFSRTAYCYVLRPTVASSSSLTHATDAMASVHGISCASEWWPFPFYFFSPSSKDEDEGEDEDGDGDKLFYSPATAWERYGGGTTEVEMRATARTVRHSFTFVRKLSSWFSSVETPWAMHWQDFGNQVQKTQENARGILDAVMPEPGQRSEYEAARRNAVDTISRWASLDDELTAADGPSPAPSLASLAAALCKSVLALRYIRPMPAWWTREKPLVDETAAAIAAYRAALSPLQQCSSSLVEAQGLACGTHHVIHENLSADDNEKAQPALKDAALAAVEVVSADLDRIETWGKMNKEYFRAAADFSKAAEDGIRRWGRQLHALPRTGDWAREDQAMLRQNVGRLLKQLAQLPFKTDT
ncbi:hypothetical protein MKZ38_003911 [Zalerion maritima]|uniref:Uncharacterized protein n=1 Tax=Zalerion maritima TaxID=339359 RepID=A0AAD5RNG7_9PEZI|nr:hypothetical protein MKZ38_003911 [Zalerion maritima]